MERKYFSAESLEAATAKAVQYFACEEAQLTIEVETGSEGSGFWQILAIKGTSDAASNLDGAFRLFYEEDGVYLELYEKRGTGIPFDRAALSLLLRRKQLQKLDGNAALTLTSKGSGRTKIAPPQVEHLYGEFLLVDVPDSEMEAEAVLLAPEKGGAELSYEEAYEKVLQARIKHGFNEEVLRKLLKDKDYGKSYTIAKATPPEDGVNGKIVFHFNTEIKNARPKEIEHGRVDYKTLELYEACTEGQKLVTRELATEGIQGTTVTGNPIKQKPGKDVTLPRSKNTEVNDDKTEIYAKYTGLVEYVGGSVNVSNIYKVEGDCDLSSGNIDFDGSVFISNNVTTGFCVKATGGVVVGGVVEAAEIYAGGNIEVKRGMQGMDKGKLEAEGSVSALYIERGIVSAGESITVEASIHSLLEAGGSIYAKGKRGNIIGGVARATGVIVANSIGSVSHTQTEVEVGFTPKKRARLNFLETELATIIVEKDKLDKISAYLEKVKDKMNAESWEKLSGSTCESIRVYSEKLDAYTDEMMRLKEEEKNATEGKIHVLGTIYPGVKITIASTVYLINTEQKFSTFKYRGGEIVFSPCEISKN